MLIIEAIGCQMQKPCQVWGPPLEWSEESWSPRIIPAIAILVCPLGLSVSPAGKDTTHTGHRTWRNKIGIG